MHRLKLPLTLLAFTMLTACATLQPQSKTPSSAPTNNQALPVISCGQHEPDAALPDYPLPGSDLTAYITAQAEWGVKAAGIVQSEKILRHNTAACLDTLEAKGLIIQGQ